MAEDASRLPPPPQNKPTKSPSSVLLVDSFGPPGPALQRYLDQGAARRTAAERSANKTTKDPKPAFATQVFPQLPYLKTQRSSCIEVLVFSERTLAERQADFHRRLCARLEEVQQGQENLQQWLATRLEAGLSLPPDHPARAQYINADGSPLLPSQIEVLDDEVDGDGDDRSLPQFAKATEREDDLDYHEDEVHSSTGRGAEHEGTLGLYEGPTSEGQV